MCGISGTLGIADVAVVGAMNDAMRHRGPDDQGVFSDSAMHVALGHRRLSILDLTTAGHQPMAYGNGRYRIVYNGEIYNYCEVREELAAVGRRFSSESDTEVLVAAYAEWGPECVKRFRGMFAYAIVDRDAPNHGGTALFLARDRLGIKPLYYSAQRGLFVFASELKGMLASGLISRRVDRQAICHYLSLGSVPQPRTILSDVKMLMPGHWIKIRVDGAIQIGKYWDIAEHSRESFPNLGNVDEADAAAQLRALLEDATRLHLLADVPVGAFLSGGIDSTAVVSLMSRVGGRPIRTFSIGFENVGGGTDERQWAEMASRATGSCHSHVVISESAVASQFDRIVQAWDQPSLDGVNTFLVSEIASKTVKVALSGLGGDELFAGYPHFKHIADAERWDKFLAFVGLSGCRQSLRLLPNILTGNQLALLELRLQRLETLRNLAGGLSKRIAGPALLESVSGAAIEDVYRSLLRPEMDAIGEATYAEVGGYLVNTLLRDADAMSMANSLEVRPLLLDHVVAEFAFALPSRLKLSRSKNKPILVNALRDLLPSEVVHRRKMGFELPLCQWLGSGLKERALAAFSSSVARQLLSSEYLQSTVANLQNGGRQSWGSWANFVLLEWVLANQCEI